MDKRMEEIMAKTKMNKDDAPLQLIYIGINMENELIIDIALL